MSIDAATGAKLIERNITSTADLTRIVPGLTFATSPVETPVYVLRGVGLYDTGLASSPAVTVYLDQVPLASNVISEVAPIDLERVEVLKGPQGTLFGSNATGGAINYIAAKPTASLSAGGNITYERFGELNTNGFISGPLSDTIAARLSLGAISGGAWQYNTSRPGDRLGDKKVWQGRLVLDWKPTDQLRFELTATAFRDNSDTQAQQFVLADPVVAAAASPALLAHERTPNDARAADWPAGEPLRSDDRYRQVSVRADWELAPQIELTSLTSYQHFDEDKRLDTSGQSLSSGIFTEGPSDLQREVGTVSSVFQELRVAKTRGQFRWIVGGNYLHTDVHERQLIVSNETIDRPLPNQPPFVYLAGRTDQPISEYAGFGNVDFELARQLTVHAGLRYTISDRRGISCTYSYNPAGDNNALSKQINGLQQFFIAIGVKNTPFVQIAPDGCVNLTPAPQLLPGEVVNTLNERNLSWRFGVDFKPSPGILLYANASRGYKAGVISVFVASQSGEFTPVKQERLDAYETGFKVTLADGRVHLNGAGFYYIYDNKQVRSYIADPLYGLLENIQNVPKSSVTGAEFDIQAAPIRGLNLDLSGTYLDSKVTGTFLSYNAEAKFGDFKGAPLPYTSKYQAVADAQYQWSVSPHVDAFLGSSLIYHSRANGTFNSAAAPAPDINLDAFTLLDLRAGIADPDGAWRATLFGRNVTNAFYTVAYLQGGDARTRSVGRPVSYGLTLSFRLR